MSNFGAAQAASAYIPVPVIARETLYTGAVVKIKVPIGATDGSYSNGDEEIPFLRFCHNIRSGRVNFFVCTKDTALLGRTITAVASVLKKTLEDGREYLYVDLTPVSNDTPITHRLTVMNNIDGSWNSDDHLIFETPAPLNGIIIFAPPGAKMVPAGTVVQMRAPVPTRLSSTTGDSQLDRLLGDGWTIDSEAEDPARVNLFRMKGDIRKTMVHYRPKNQRK